MPKSATIFRLVWNGVNTTNFINWISNTAILTLNFVKLAIKWNKKVAILNNTFKRCSDIFENLDIIMSV